MHGAVLNRHDYVRFLCDGVPPSYPKRTAEAIQEMQDRGIATSLDYIRNLINLKKVKPERRGRDNWWSAELIDATIDALARAGCLSPLAVTCTVFRISARTFWTEATRAWEQLRSEWGGELTGPDFDINYFNWNIEPRHPAESKLTLTPSKAFLARMEAYFESGSKRSTANA